MLQFSITRWLILFSELSEETVEILLSTASLLQLHPVTKACCDFLEKQLDPCNCLGIALFAEQQSCLGLHKSALDYTHQHFMQVKKYFHYYFLFLCFTYYNILVTRPSFTWCLKIKIYPSLLVKEFSKLVQ